MKKMIWFTTFLILFLVLIVPAILGLALDIIPAGEQPGYDANKRLSIYGERGVAQKFTSQDANLSAIGTSIRNPNLKNKKEIILNLYDQDKKLIRTSILNGQNVQDGDFVKFIFTPITESMNMAYTFTIFSPLAGPEETVEVFYFDTPTETVLEFTYDEQTYPGGFPLVTFHKPNSKFEVVKQIYSSLFSRLQLSDYQKP